MPRAGSQWFGFSLDPDFEQPIQMRVRQSRDRLELRLAGLRVLRQNLVANLDVLDRHVAVIRVNRRPGGEALSALLRPLDLALRLPRTGFKTVTPFNYSAKRVSVWLAKLS
jgi:hypothetical protein